MTPTERERIIEEAEKYGFQVPYDGSSEFYDRSAVKAYIAGAIAEHEKARNQAIDDCISECDRVYKDSSADISCYDFLNAIERKLKSLK